MDRGGGAERQEPRRIVRAWIRAIPALGAVVFAAGLSSARQRQPDRIGAAIETLRTPDATGEQKLDATEHLLSHVDQARARAALQEALWDDRPTGVRRLVAQAAAASPHDPSALARSFGTALSSAVHEPTHEADALSLLDALGRCPTRDAVRAVVEHAVAPEGITPALREGAYAALSRQTGLTQTGDLREAWLRWWERAQWLAEDEWPRHAGIGEAPTLAPPAALVEIASAGQRIAMVYSRLHALTAEADRDRLLIEMLGAPEEAVRSAAFELIMTSLVNAKPVGDEAAAAAAQRLSDPSPVIRAEAARTVELLDRPASAPLLRLAIEQEPDPTAAAAMLRAASRAPATALIEPALRWLASAEPVAMPAAAEALDALARAGLLESHEIRERVHTSLMVLAPASWAAPACRLAARTDLTNPLIGLLAQQDRERARECAAALADVPQALDMLVAAATSHPDLYESTATALARHAANADGFASLAALPAPSEKDRLDARAMMARALAPGELLRLARTSPDEPSRARLLAAVITPEYLAVANDLPDRVELALLLARSQVRSEWTQDALSTLDLLPTGWQGPRALSLRVTALLCLNRRAEAEAVAPPPTPPEAPLLPEDLAADAWLDALEWCAGAGALHDAFESRFGVGLSPEQSLRFRSLHR